MHKVAGNNQRDTESREFCDDRHWAPNNTETINYSLMRFSLSAKTSRCQIDNYFYS